jgi:hypothetical protein
MPTDEPTRRHRNGDQYAFLDDAPFVYDSRYIVNQHFHDSTIAPSTQDWSLAPLMSPGKLGKGSAHADWWRRGQKMRYDPPGGYFRVAGGGDLI